VQSGKLDRRLQLQRRTLTRNVHGEQVATYATYATVWAQRLDVTGREFFASQNTLAENTARFLIRFRDDVELTDRLLCESTYYDIKQRSELGRRESMELIAVARVS
jgi:SPP1 family predicted phage head-tail adaptor